VCLTGAVGGAGGAPLTASYAQVWMVVEAPDVDQVGAFLKIGGETTGYGVGMGAGSFNHYGTSSGTLIALREHLSWVIPSSPIQLRGERALVAFFCDGSVLRMWKRSRFGNAAYSRYASGGTGVNALSGAANLFGYTLSDSTRRYCQGKIGEVEGYLAQKWRIPLTIDHPYAARAPKVGMDADPILLPSRRLVPKFDVSVSGWTGV
jgi:hypothetical protein